MINTKFKITQPITSTEVVAVIKKTEHEILAYVQNVRDDLSILGAKRFDSWQFPLYYYNESLVRYNTAEFLHLNPLQKHLEILRAEAEAYLIHQNLSCCGFTSQERNFYLQRAAGILPENEEERFLEILTCPGFRPPELQNLYNDIELFKQGLQYIKKAFGQSTALLFGLLIQNGVKSISEFKYYGQKIDLLFQEIMKLPDIQALLEQRHFDLTFENQFIFLATLRDRILKYLPQRRRDEQNIFITNILNRDWKNSRAIEGSAIVFSALDAIILSKFGFDTKFASASPDETLYLEIITPEKTLYWEPLSDAAISYFAPFISYRGDFLFLISQTFVKMANRYAEMGRDLDKAIDLFQKSINLTPDIPARYADLSKIYLKTNNPKKAIQYLQKAIEMESDVVDYYELLGVTYCLVQDWSKAISVFKSAITIKPQSIETLNNLGYCYEQIGELHKAEDIYRQILVLEPSYFKASFGLANVYFALKRYELAIYYYAQALKSDPQSEHCFYNLARTYYENGDVKKVLKSIENYCD